MTAVDGDLHGMIQKERQHLASHCFCVQACLQSQHVYHNIHTTTSLPQSDPILDEAMWAVHTGGIAERWQCQLQLLSTGHAACHVSCQAWESQHGSG